MEQMVAEGEPVRLTAAQEALSDKQFLALQGLLAGKSTAEAGAEVGRCARTVQLWMQEPAFRQALREGREVLLKEMSTRLHFNGAWAVDQLRILALDESAGGYARAYATRALIELMTRAALADDQTEQIAEIRAELAAIRKAAAGEEATPA